MHSRNTSEPRNGNSVFNRNHSDSTSHASSAVVRRAQEPGAERSQRATKTTMTVAPFRHPKRRILSRSTRKGTRLHQGTHVLSVGPSVHTCARAVFAGSATREVAGMSWARTRDEMRTVWCCSVRPLRQRTQADQQHRQNESRRFHHITSRFRLQHKVARSGERQ